MRRVWHEIYGDKSPIACGVGRVNAVSSSDAPPGRHPAAGAARAAGEISPARLRPLASSIPPARPLLTASAVSLDRRLSCRERPAADRLGGAAYLGGSHAGRGA